MSYLDHNCGKCKTSFHYQVPRSAFFKLFFGFLPIRIYWCPKCTVNRYVWVAPKKARNMSYSSVGAGQMAAGADAAAVKNSA